MPSNFFRGGLDYINNNATPWDLVADLKCSAVAGTSINSSNRYWTTLDDFIVSGGNTLVGDEADVPQFPNRGTAWAGDPTFAHLLWFNDPLSFGVIGAGQNVAGIVFYSGARATPASATLWLCSENSGGFFTGDGGIVTVGTAGQNIAGRWQALEVLNRFSFQGTLEMYISNANIWGDGTWRVGYALVRSTTTATPSRAWRLMSDLPAGVIYCTGAGPGAANQPETLLADREGPEIALNTDGDVYEWGIASARTPITWPNADLTPGEIVTAVIAFAYQGAYNPATAWVLHWDDVANHTIQAAQDVTYAQPGSRTITQGLI